MRRKCNAELAWLKTLAKQSGVSTQTAVAACVAFLEHVKLTEEMAAYNRIAVRIEGMNV